MSSRPWRLAARVDRGRRRRPGGATVRASPRYDRSAPSGALRRSSPPPLASHPPTSARGVPRQTSAASGTLTRRRRRGEVVQHGGLQNLYSPVRIRSSPPPFPDQITAYVLRRARRRPARDAHRFRVYRTGQWPHCTIDLGDDPTEDVASALIAAFDRSAFSCGAAAR